MSLMDALLEEEFDATPPSRTNAEFWIARRRDGLKGTGTQADPYDGSVLESATIQITSLQATADPLVGLAYTVTAHGYQEGDLVCIRAVMGAGAAQWNGTF